MRITRRRFLRDVAVAATAAMLTACGPTPTPTPKSAATPSTGPGKVILRLMDNWGTPANAKYAPLRSALEDFMALYPNIEITEEVFGDQEIPVKVDTAFMAGQEPEVVFQNLHQSALEWLNNKVAIDVKDLAKQWGLWEQLRPDALAEWTDDQGRLRALPLEGYTWPVWYNTRILTEAGVKIPKTTDDLIVAAQKIRKAGYQPFAAGGMEYTGQYVVFLTLATTLTDAEIRQVYNKGEFSKNDHAVAGVRLFVKLRDEGAFCDHAEGMTNAAVNQMFYSEKAAMMHGGAWFYAECPASVKEHVTLGGFPLPAASSRKKPIMYMSFEGKGTWITRNGTKKIDAVEKFVKFFYRPEIMKRFVEQAAMTSPLKETPVDASKLDPLFRQSISKDFMDSVEVALIHKVYVPVAADKGLRRAASEAWLPGTSAETILTNFDTVYKG